MQTKQTARRIIVLLSVVSVFVLAACQPVMPVSDMESTETAMSDDAAPGVTVDDQPIVDGTVTIAQVISDGPGWIVIHTQADGGPGPIIGYEPVADGANADTAVQVDAAAATDTLYAMLHTDAGEIGTWEFPGGADVPVKDSDGNVITPAFAVLAGEMDDAMAETPLLQIGGNDELGEFLVDAEGLTLYMFTKDEPGVTNCYDTCAEKWPPLFVEGDITLADGLDQTLVGTTERTDGGVQLTYNGWPLYYWMEDTAPGDAYGQNVGEVWFVLSPAGEIIR